MEELSIQQTAVSPRVAPLVADDVIARYIEWRGAWDALAGAFDAWANGEGADCFAELDHENPLRGSAPRQCGRCNTSCGPSVRPNHPGPGATAAASSHAITVTYAATRPWL
jgi:hypothetical protein